MGGLIILISPYHCYLVFHSIHLHGTVAQAATDVLEVSNEAIETEVTSEVEETLLAIQHTYRDRGSILQ